MVSDNQSPESWSYISDGRLGLLFVIEILACKNAAKMLPAVETPAAPYQ